MVRWVGFTHTRLPVAHKKRYRGKTTYNFGKSISLAFNTILGHSDKPLRLIVYLGLCISFFAFILGVIVLYRYFYGQINVIGYASVLTSICFFSGVLVSVMGIIGLYVGKVFNGIKGRPIYIRKEKING